MDLTCPKCHGRMRTYERNGVHVDQCTDCRGIFLDRGELERLVDAENSWHGDAAAPAAPAAPAASQPGAGATGSSQLGAVVGEVLQQARAAKHGRYGQQYGHGYDQRRRKKSFLDELFG
jgi:Zn-finger nucleic acid-binding protein